MKIFLTQDEIKNHYRKKLNLDKSIEIEIENLSTLHDTDLQISLEDASRTIFNLLEEINGSC